MGVVPASAEALSSFGVDASPEADGVLWAASYPCTFESVSAIGSGPTISLAAAMADAIGGSPPLPFPAASPAALSGNGFIVGGSGRFLAAAVARLDCRRALLDRIQASPPKEQVEMYHGAVLAAVDACVLAWLQHLAAEPGSGQHYQDLRVAASIHVGPMLGSRGFASIDVDGGDFASLLALAKDQTDSSGAVGSSFVSHKASLALAIACYRDLLDPKSASNPSAPTFLRPGQGRETAAAILELLQQQPPPPRLSDDDDRDNSRDPWAGAQIF